MSLAPRLPRPIPTIHTRQPGNAGTQVARSKMAATCDFLGRVIRAHYVLQARNHQR